MRNNTRNNIEARVRAHVGAHFGDGYASFLRTTLTNHVHDHGVTRRELRTIAWASVNQRGKGNPHNPIRHTFLRAAYHSGHDSRFTR